MIKKDSTREIFAIIFEFLIAAFCLSCIGYIIFHLVPGVNEKEKARITAEFIPRVKNLLLPEYQERTTFVMVVLLSPLLCWGSILCCKNIIRTVMASAANCSRMRQYYSFSISVALILLATVNFIFDPQFLSVLFMPVMKNPLITCLICLITAIAIPLTIKFNLNRYLLKGLPPVLLILPLLQILCCRIYTLDRLVNEYDDHINIVSYALSQAVAGLNDYHIYGFYCRMLAPLLSLTGTGVFNISIIMGILYMVAIFCIYWTMFRIIKNKIWVIGFALILFYIFGMSVFLHHNSSFKLDPYFAYFPIRLFCPAIALLCYYMLITSKQKYWIAACGSVAGCGLLWNVDSGIATAGAFGGVLFAEFIFTSGKKEAFRRIVLYVISLSVALFLTFALLWIHNGNPPPVISLLKYLNIFYSGGYMMLPMPGMPAAWCFIAGIYVLGLTAGIHDFAAGKFNIVSRMNLFLSVLGIGLFAYYQGRSHIFNLPSVCWPAMMILFIFTDHLIRLAKAKLIDGSFKILLFPALFLAICAFVSFPFDVIRLSSGISRTMNGIIEMQQINPMEADVRFILANAGNNKVVNILSDMQGVYYAETGLRAGIDNFSVVEQLLEKDRVRTFTELQTAKSPLFVSAFPDKKAKVPAWIYEHYKLEAVNHNGSLLYFVPASPLAAGSTQIEK